MSKKSIISRAAAARSRSPGLISPDITLHVYSSSMKYWLIIDSVQKGPLSIEEVAAQPGLNPSTPVWHEGLGDWTTAGAVPEIAALFPATASPGRPSPSRTTASRDIIRAMLRTRATTSRAGTRPTDRTPTVASSPMATAAISNMAAATPISRAMASTPTSFPRCRATISSGPSSRQSAAASRPALSPSSTRPKSPGILPRRLHGRARCLVQSTALDYHLNRSRSHLGSVLCIVQSVVSLMPAEFFQRYRTLLIVAGCIAAWRWDYCIYMWSPHPGSIHAAASRC